MKLSVNVNKVATLRNSRGGDEPCLVRVVEDLIRFGAWGITLHPRPDERHILYRDVRDISQFLQKFPSVELNVEGYPGENFLNLIRETRPHQCTLVPDPPEALTSDEGWDLESHFSFLEKVLGFLKRHKVRSSIFVDPLCFKPSALERLGPDRVEFYTGHWARVFESQFISQKMSQGKINPIEGKNNLNEKCLKILDIHKTASRQVCGMGIGVNAGHDLNQQNLRPLLEGVPLIREVSIGHAFISEALYDGLQLTLKKYHKILSSVSSGK